MAFGSDVPVIVLSPAFGAVITGVAVLPISVAVAVIVALSFVIGVPAGVDHTGSLYPSFAFAVGYLSAVNATPSFTSYTGGFVKSSTPSPATNVTLW